MSQRNILTAQWVAVALIGIVLAACDSGTATHEPAEAVASTPVSETMVAAKLAGADLVDGDEDFVVSRCPGCALAMDGSADHALQVKGYELHFCSDSCRGKFEEDVMAKVAELEVPELPEL